MPTQGKLGAVLLLFAAIATAASAAVLEAGKTEVVIAPGAPKTVEFAAKEMKHFLDGVLGADVAVVRAPTPGATPVFLGVGAASTGIEASVDGFCRDEFRIVSNDGGVFIFGRDDAKANPERALSSTVWSQHYERATLFGVYEFLERFAGVRMYFPGELGEVVPRRGRVDVPAADFRVKPAMDMKRCYSFFGEGVWFEGESRDAKATGALRWLNSYRLRMETRSVPCCHGLAHRGYPERFAKDHPEYFPVGKDGKRFVTTGLRNSGQLCHSSGVWNEIYLDVKSYLTGESPDVRGIVAPNGRHGWWYSCQDRRYVDIMPQDGMMACQCDKCLAAYDKGDSGNYLDTLIWRRTAEVGNRLIREGVPGTIVQMAYQPYRRVPDVDLPTNLLVMVAERGPWSVPHPAVMQAECDEIAAWSRKLGHKVFIWTYPLKYSSRVIPGLPDGTPWMWAEYYGKAAPFLNGIYAESDTDRFLYKHLDYYVLSRITWDPGCDAAAVIDEYFDLMYGPAAETMKKIARSFERRWACGVLGRTQDTMWGPSFAPAHPRKIWTDVYSRKVVARYLELFDRAASLTREGSLERRRVELMRRELGEPLKAAAEPHWLHFEELDRYVIGEGESQRLVPVKDSVKGGDAVETRFSFRERDGSIVFEVDCDEPCMDKAVERASDRVDDTVAFRRNSVQVILTPQAEPKFYYLSVLESAGATCDMTMDWAKRPVAIELGWNHGGACTAARTSNGWKATIEIPLAAMKDLGTEPRLEVTRNRVLSDGTTQHYHWSALAKNYTDCENFGKIVRKSHKKGKGK